MYRVIHRDKLPPTKWVEFLMMSHPEFSAVSDLLIAMYKNGTSYVDSTSVLTDVQKEKLRVDHDYLTRLLFSWLGNTLERLSFVTSGNMSDLSPELQKNMNDVFVVLRSIFDKKQ